MIKLNIRWRAEGATICQHLIETCPPTTYPEKVQKILKENVIRLTQVLDPSDQSMQKVEFRDLLL
jgi:hypothetical protein